MIIAWMHFFLTDHICDDYLLQVQGAIIVSSLFQVVIGFTGVIGFLMRFIGPLSIAPTITLIGLALFQSAANSCSTHWGISIL